MGMVDGPNLYRYVSGNPVRLVDPSGTEPRGGPKASDVTMIDYSDSTPEPEPRKATSKENTLGIVASDIADAVGTARVATKEAETKHSEQRTGGSSAGGTKQENREDPAGPKAAFTNPAGLVLYLAGRYGGLARAAVQKAAEGALEAGKEAAIGALDVGGTAIAGAAVAVAIVFYPSETGNGELPNGGPTAAGSPDIDKRSDPDRAKDTGSGKSGDDESDKFITLYKAPTQAQATAIGQHGFRKKDFPGPGTDPYGPPPNGFAYFFLRPNRELFDFAKIRGAGILKIRIPGSKFFSEFSPEIAEYPTDPNLLEALISNKRVELLNQFQIEFVPYP